MDRKCSNCVYAILVDFGYSNYTVEGTSVYCAKMLNPVAPFDRWYGEDDRDKFAEKCQTFHYGDPVDIDCDTEGLVESEDANLKWQNYASGFVSGQEIEDVIE